MPNLNPNPCLTQIPTPIPTPQSQEFSVLSWSKNGAYLAVGTVKGNLLMYSSRERKRVPYVGKHTKKIVSAVWNKGNLLAMAGLDRMVSPGHGDEGKICNAEEWGRVLQSARDIAISRTLFEPHCAFRAVFSPPCGRSGQFLRFLHYKALTNLTKYGTLEWGECEVPAI